MPVPEFLQDLAKRWPSTFVLQSQIPEFTNNLYSAGYVSILYREGLGPRRVAFGGKVVYPVKEFVEWLASRITEDLQNDPVPVPPENQEQTASDAG